MKKERLLVEKYFEENNFIQSNIESFNHFIKNKMQQIVDEVKDATPAVIPPDVEEVKFEFGQITIKRPVVIEADGSERKLLPMEARLRNLTYSAPVYLEVGLIIDNKERERAEVQILDIPIMVRSDLCYLSELNKEQRIDAGEDPNDTGGYFIVNGTERVLVLLEDLAPNSIFVKEEKSGPATHRAQIFSESQSYRVPHLLERTKDGLFVLSFSNLKRVPFAIVLKALGLTTDKQILQSIGIDEMNEDLYLNLYEASEIKTKDEAQEFIAKTMSLALTKERKIQRVNYVLDNLFMPHIGRTPKDRQNKAHFLGRMAKKLMFLIDERISEDDKDHYMNKRVRLSGDLFEDLFRTNFKVLVNDVLYIFQRGIRRGRMLPISSIVRTNLLSQRIRSAMATGKWTAKRQGVSQRLERDNAIVTLSHLGRVVSLLETTRESFQARELHPTHWGRLCPVESPEGKNIGLRKNLALLASITPELDKEEIERNISALSKFGLEKLK